MSRSFANGAASFLLEAFLKVEEAMGLRANAWTKAGQVAVDWRPSQKLISSPR
jgi:hypothetical protein